MMGGHEHPRSSYAIRTYRDEVWQYGVPSAERRVFRQNKFGKERGILDLEKG